MQVSVIIPVFNAATFLEEAVRSALDQPETAEVLLVEDGSTDDSLYVCRSMCEADARVRLLTHPDKKNHGAGASRNLGLLSATQEFIAFLDADDVYLPSRFAVTQEIFRTTPEADGVYETVGTLYTDKALRTRHLARVPTEDTGLLMAVPPEKLFRTLAMGRSGHIHLNGLVICRCVLDKNSNFDTSLRQCQDSDWILRLAAYRNLYAGIPGKHVALRRVHDDNRVFNSREAFYYQRMYLRKCIMLDFYDSTDNHANLYILARYVSWLWDRRLRSLGRFSKPVIIMGSGLYLLLHPGLIFRMFLRHKR